MQEGTTQERKYQEEVTFGHLEADYHTEVVFKTNNQLESILWNFSIEQYIDKLYNWSLKIMTTNCIEKSETHLVRTILNL